MDINDLLNDPEKLKVFFNDEKVREALRTHHGLDVKTERGPSRKKMAEGIRVSKKYDRYKQFRGCTIQIVSKRIKDGMRTISFPANGNSEKETLALLDEEVKLLQKKYRVTDVVY
jgi:hypothetical protein